MASPLTLDERSGLSAGAGTRFGVHPDNNAEASSRLLITA
jgi:hypothetical protein